MKYIYGTLCLGATLALSGAAASDIYNEKPSDVYKLILNHCQKSENEAACGDVTSNCSDSLSKSGSYSRADLLQCKAEKLGLQEEIKALSAPKEKPPPASDIYNEKPDNVDEIILNHCKKWENKATCGDVSSNCFDSLFYSGSYSKAALRQCKAEKLGLQEEIKALSAPKEKPQAPANLPRFSAAAQSLLREKCKEVDCVPYRQTCNTQAKELYGNDPTKPALYIQYCLIRDLGLEKALAEAEKSGPKPSAAKDQPQQSSEEKYLEGLCTGRDFSFQQRSEIDACVQKGKTCITSDGLLPATKSAKFRRSADGQTGFEVSTDCKNKMRAAGKATETKPAEQPSSQKTPEETKGASGEAAESNSQPR